MLVEAHGPEADHLPVLLYEQISERGVGMQNLMQERALASYMQLASGMHAPP